MRSDELRELAGNENFISGIYNYCDRWCERCPFTSRCFLYATEKADPDLADPEARDITSEKFWRHLESIFRSTAELIAEWAAETGVDLKSIDVSQEMAEHEREVEEAEENELSQAARHYATTVENWFRDEFATEENVYDDMPQQPDIEDPEVGVQDASEIIRWYQFFIAVKLMRALTGNNHAGDDVDDDEDDLSMDFLGYDEIDDEDVDYDEVIAKTDRMDMNGSAKVALVAIDRSIGAWRVLQFSLPEKSDTIKPILIALDGLRRGVETRFPRARDFIRPGLDESLSDFVS